MLQGWISSAKSSNFSEAVIVNFNKNIISVDILIEIILLTHNSSSKHSFRAKYISAIYIFSKEQELKSKAIV